MEVMAIACSTLPRVTELNKRKWEVAGQLTVVPDSTTSSVDTFQRGT